MCALTVLPIFHGDRGVGWAEGLTLSLSWPWKMVVMEVRAQLNGEVSQRTRAITSTRMAMPCALRRLGSLFQPTSL